MSLCLCLGWVGGAHALPVCYDEVSINLGEDIADRMTHPQVPDGDTLVVTIGGRLARRNVDTTSDPHFYFAVADLFAWQGSRPDMYITIEYYDTGSGKLELQYDSADPNGLPYPHYKSAGSVSLTGTNKWRNFTWIVHDAYFGNRQNGGADFRIVKANRTYFYIDTVTVRAVLPMSSVLGSTHVAGGYSFDASHDYLNEGAIEIANTGLRSIKLWFRPDDPAGSYPFNSHWPGSFGSLKAMAEHPYYKEVFRRPFETCLLTVADGYDFKDGFPEPKPSVLEQEFYLLARYLIETYRGTGKTFILGHWEGDWMLRKATNLDPANDPEPIYIEGMIRWLNARQAGVNRARQEVPPVGMHIYAAAEVNNVELIPLGRPTVTSHVLPHTNMDLVTYSAWGGLQYVRTSGETVGRQKFREALQTIAAYMPDSSTLDPHGRPFGDKNLAIGEFGAGEIAVGSSMQALVTKVAVEEAYAFGCPWMFYWQVYCNDYKTPIVSNSNFTGYWLRRFDGTSSAARNYLLSQVGLYLKPPADFQITVGSGDIIHLVWTDTPDEDYYRIERSKDGGLYTLAALPGQNVVAFDDETCGFGGEFRYRLRAEKSGRPPPPWYYSDPIILPLHTPDKPIGAARGYLSASFVFQTGCSTCPDGSFEYQFDWGDGQLSSWGGNTASYRWAAAGKYEVRARARPAGSSDDSCSSTFSSAATIVVYQVDLDGDGDVDLSDFGILQGCFTRSGESITTQCQPADLNRDGQINNADSNLFFPCMAGPDVPHGC